MSSLTNFSLRKLRLSFVSLVLGLALSAPAEGDDKKLSLSEYLEQVMARHPRFQTQQLSIDIEKQRLAEAAGKEDWILHSRPAVQHQEPVSASTFNSEELDNLVFDVSVDRPVWRTGGQFGLSYTYQYTDQVPPILEIPNMPGQGINTSLATFHEHGIFLSYTQPLLKNRGGILSRLETDLREFTVEMSELQARENEEDFLLRMANLYLDWVLAVRRSEIAAERLKLSEEELVRLKDQRARNMIDEVNLLRGEDDIRKSQQNKLLADSEVIAIKGQLDVLASRPVQVNEVPAFDYADLPGWKVDAATLDQQLTELRSIRLLSLDEQRSQLEASALTSDEKPQLDLVLSGGMRSGEDTYSDSIELDQPEARASLVFAVPLGNSSAVASVRRARLEAQRAKSRKADVTLSLQSAIQNLSERLEKLLPVIKLSGERIDVAHRRTGAERENYKKGKGSYLFVLQSQNSETLAHELHAQNIIRYHRFHLELQALLDQLHPDSE